MTAAQVMPPCYADNVREPTPHALTVRTRPRPCAPRREEGVPAGVGAGRPNQLRKLGTLALIAAFIAPSNALAAMPDREFRFTGQNSVLNGALSPHLPTATECWFDVELQLAPDRDHPPTGFFWRIPTPSQAEFINSQELLITRVRPKTFGVITVEGVFPPLGVIPPLVGKAESIQTHTIQASSIFADFSVSECAVASCFYLLQGGATKNVALTATNLCPAGGTFQWLRDNPNQPGPTTSTWEVDSANPISFQVGLRYSLEGHEHDVAKRLTFVSLDALTWTDEEFSFPYGFDPDSIKSGSIMAFDIPFAPDTSPTSDALTIAFTLFDLPPPVLISEGSTLDPNGRRVKRFRYQFSAGSADIPVFNAEILLQGKATGRATGPILVKKR